MAKWFNKKAKKSTSTTITSSSYGDFSPSLQATDSQDADPIAIQDNLSEEISISGTCVVCVSGWMPPLSQSTGQWIRNEKSIFSLLYSWLNAATTMTDFLIEYIFQRHDIAPSIIYIMAIKTIPDDTTRPVPLPGYLLILIIYLLALVCCNCYVCCSCNIHFLISYFMSFRLKCFASEDNCNICYPLDAREKCVLCAVAFTFFRRVHHCRLCDVACCDDCSRKRGIINNKVYQSASDLYYQLTLLSLVKCSESVFATPALIASQHAFKACSVKN